jgi:hypothetical protein
MEFLKSEKLEGSNTEIGKGTIDFNKITPMPKWIFSEDMEMKHMEKYGWEGCQIGWSALNWGSKWNAHNIADRKKTGNTIYFMTACNGVPYLIQKIAYIFPDIIIKYSSTSEDIGYAVESFTFKDTDILLNKDYKNCSKEAYELWIEINQSSFEDYGLVYNEQKNTYIYDEKFYNYNKSISNWIELNNKEEINE